MEENNLEIYVISHRHETMIKSHVLLQRSTDEETKKCCRYNPRCIYNVINFVSPRVSRVVWAKYQRKKNYCTDDPGSIYKPMNFPSSHVESHEQLRRSAKTIEHRTNDPRNIQKTKDSLSWCVKPHASIGESAEKEDEQTPSTGHAENGLGSNEKRERESKPFRFT